MGKKRGSTKGFDGGVATQQRKKSWEKNPLVLQYHITFDLSCHFTRLLSIELKF